MAKPEISKVVESETFQIWLNKTNELVEILNDNIVTASVSGSDVTNGNVTLNGNFTANNISVTSAAATDVSLTTIVHRTDPEVAIIVNSPILINGPANQENLLEVKSNFGAKPIIALTNGAGRKWNIALETANDSSPLVIRSGSANSTPQLSLSQAGVLNAPSFQGNGSLLTNINPSNIGSGTVPTANIPNLDTAKITTGVFTLARIPTLDSGRVPSLDTAKITTGIFDIARIPDLDTGKITTGLLPVSRGGTGAGSLTTGSVLVGAGTSAVVSSGLTWLTASNRLGVNITTPTQALHVSGNILATGEITAFSDEKLKSDVETIDSALEKVGKLRGVYYTKDGRRGTGVIAQEIELTIPEVVFDENEFKSVAYGNLVGLLIEAVKELTKEVENLKNGS